MRGASLGPYEVVEPIAAGGMGQVYRATDRRLHRSVAIKVLSESLRDRAELRERFRSEAALIASLSHPHICQLYDVGEHDGVAFFVMELLDGETLATRLQRGPLKIEPALRQAREMADALDAAHRRGIVHRDLKPSNVMLTTSGVKLLDFGVARWLAPELAAIADDATKMTSEQRLTPTGTPLGTSIGSFSRVSPRTRTNDGSPPGT
jgi:serine/threonine protein kinase